jgi:hypothetical protein
MEDVMMQIGDLQPQPALPSPFPPQADQYQKPADRLSDDEQEVVFISPPPMPWPRVFPGL